MKRFIRSGQSGFSLIEILAALAIFGLCIVGLIEGITQTLASWRLAEEKTAALMLCENLIEEIKASETIEAGEDGATFEPPHDGYTWSSVIDVTEIPNLYTVGATVTWLSSGHEESVSLHTLKLQQTITPAAEASPTPSAGGAR